MTAADAEQIIVLMSAATGGKVDPETLDYFNAALRPLDYEVALAAATIGTTLWRFFPSWAEFKEVYKSQHTRLRPEPAPSETFPKVAKGRAIPDWVRRWVAARFLYSRFDKEQDLRPFPEQSDYTDPTKEKMPEDAWVEEAKKISDADIWKAIGR